MTDFSFFLSPHLFSGRCGSIDNFMLSTVLLHLSDHLCFVCFVIIGSTCLKCAYLYVQQRGFDDKVRLII